MSMIFISGPFLVVAQALVQKSYLSRALAVSQGADYRLTLFAFPREDHP
jgi:hypothetical protein